MQIVRGLLLYVRPQREVAKVKPKSANHKLVRLPSLFDWVFTTSLSVNELAILSLLSMRFVFMVVGLVPGIVPKPFL